MKKNPIIFIAMLVALAFTSCQMNTDDSVVIPPAPTYTIKVNATNGTASYPNTAKAGEKVTITATANSGYVFDNASSALSIPDCKVSDDKKSITWNLTMPEKDVTINVTFKAATPAPTTEATSYKIVYGDETLKSGLTLAQVNDYINKVKLILTTDYSLDKVKGVLTLTESGLDKLNKYVADNGETETPANNGGEDNNGETPATANEYTVSVASGIKGGHFEVSPNGTEGSWSEITSKTYTKDTTIYVRPVCNNSFYKLVANTVKYTLSKGGEGFLSDNGGCITITDNTILGATFEISQGNLSTLNGEITSEFNNEEYKKNNYKCGVFISSKKSGDCFKSVEIVFGFSEYYYDGLVSSSNDGITGNVKPTYYYVLPNKVTSLSNSVDAKNNYRTWVRITGDSFVPPFDTGDTGRIYVLVEDTDGNKSMYAATESFLVGQIRYTVNID